MQNHPALTEQSAPAPASEQHPKITVAHLYKVFGPAPDRALQLLQEGRSKGEILKETRSTIAVNDAQFQVQQGETFVIMGLSGSGKSTLLRCINRLEEPTSGSVLLDEQELSKLDRKRLQLLRAQKTAMVFQRFGLFPHRTVLRNVEFGLEIQGVDKKTRQQRAQETLELVGLSGYEQSMPAALSGGMQQRVGLARALATDPEVLFMDEAFSALDPLIRREMQDELRLLQARMQKTILFVTHDLDEALKLGNRIAIMKDGTIVQIGTPEQILTNPSTGYVEDFVQEVDRSRVLTARSVMWPADELVLSHDGPRVAIRRMNLKGVPYNLVTDAQHRLAGIVHIDEAVAAADRGASNLQEILSPAQTTTPETTIFDLLPQAANTADPIAVVDEENRLLGLVVRVSILAGIRGRRREDDQPEDR